MKKTVRTYYQENGGRLLNVYRIKEEEDIIDLAIGESIIDPAENHAEGETHTTIRRVA